VGLEPSPAGLIARISDDGIGVFARVAASQWARSSFEAVEELSKGKLTTDPEHHTGEGLFFTPRAVRHFTLDANGVRWTVDGRREDMTMETLDTPPGTTATVLLAPTPERSLTEVFDRYTTDFAFDRTKTVVRLFDYGATFMSRSEGKRLTRRLEGFREVVLDFTGVRRVGQGFADQVFRVWQRAHPEVTLVPIHMEEAVAFMVERARRAADAR
jgi:hypothetical protein